MCLLLLLELKQLEWLLVLVSTRCKICIFEWLFRRSVCKSTTSFEVKGKKDKVYKLKKALNGLEQAPKAWNKWIDRFLMQQ